MSMELDPRMPARFVDLKHEIASSYPDFEARVTTAWNEILQHLEAVSLKVAESGSEVSTDSDTIRLLPRSPSSTTDKPGFSLIN